MEPIYATPFIPGEVSGTLRGADQADAGALVLVAHDRLREVDAGVAGVIVVGAAPLSHPLLRMAALDVPTVIVSPEQAQRLSQGRRYVIDGTHGIVTDPGTWERLQGSELENAGTKAGQPIYTRDREPVELRASVTGVLSVEQAVAMGASGIGIVRSEYLMPADGTQPDEAFYRQAFTELAEAAGPLPVTLRLIDLAQDKRPDWLGEVPGMRGLLGLRGSRLYGTEPVRSVFLAQARAAGTLAGRFPLQLMLPYLVRPDEFDRWAADIRAAAGDEVAVGIMAETPAAALAVDEWLHRAEFVSIGCNDLMQCLFGADRDIPELADLLDPYSPVLFRFLDQVARIAGDGIGHVQLCGLLSRVPRILPVLLGLGFRNFSLEPHLIPHLARTVSHTNIDTARALAEAVCAARDSDTVRTLLGLRGAHPWHQG